MAAHRGGRDGRGPAATVEQQHPGRAAHPGKPDPEGTRGVRQPLFSTSVCLERDPGLGHLLGVASFFVHIICRDEQRTILSAALPFPTIVIGSKIEVPYQVICLGI